MGWNMHGKCPKCEKTLSYVNIDAIDAKDGPRSWKAVSYNCPYCSSVLSVAIDPLALKADTVNEILKGLGRR